MKINIKRIAALLMTLVLLSAVSATAFATTVYSNIIVVNATEAPEATEAPAEDEVVAEEETTEAPAEDEVVAEEEATEAPAEDEVVAEEETTEAPAEDEVVAEEETIEAPAEDEVVAEEEVVVEEEVVAEPEVPAIDYEELLKDVTVEVKFEVISEGGVRMGDPVQLTAIVTGAEDLEYQIIWEYRVNEEEWTVAPELVGEVVTFPLSVDNFMSEWRARLVLVIPEMETVAP